MYLLSKATSLKTFFTQMLAYYKIFLNKRSFGEPFSKPHSKVTL